MGYRYKVITVTDCDLCQASGAVTHPAWAHLFAEHHGYPDEDTIRDWMLNHGYAYSRDITPPKEVPCGDCDDTGQIEDRVDLRNAIADLIRSGALAQRLHEGHTTTHRRQVDARLIGAIQPNIEGQGRTS